MVTADSVESPPDTDDDDYSDQSINPALNVVKSSSTTLDYGGGRGGPYTFMVTNTGNVT